MGMFDDLVPQASTAPPGANQGASFDDLIPAQGQAAPQAKPRLDAMEEPNWIEQQLAKINISAPVDYALNRVRGFVMGAADPTVGAVQLATNAVGQGDAINRAIQQKEQQYEQERQGVGATGVDIARLGGNIASPANLMIASRVAPAATTLGKIAQGAGLGAAGAATTPVVDTSGGFWGQKAGQTVLGGLAGGVAAPIVSKLGDAILRRLPAPDAELSGARASLRADQIMSDSLKEIGQSINDLPPAQVATLRAQVVDALKSGKEIDAAAALRKSDFESLGIQPTLGQITRDGTQFAREMNLRGVANVGEPLMQRFEQQGQALQQNLGKFSQGAQEAFPAGEQLTGALRGADEAMSRRVSDLYRQARESTGKDLSVPLTGLAQDYAKVVGDFADKVPTALRQKFAALGLDPAAPSNQRKVFTIEDADALLKNINDHVGSDRATNTALGQLRSAVKNAVQQADESGGPFAPAVQAASQRFKLHEAVPALEAAANGSVAPDDFVRRFVVQGKANDVRGMAQLLDADSFAQAKAQLGAYLQRAAYGENTAGDKAFAQERYNKALRDLGTAKLEAFFTPEEVLNLRAVGRVGAYISSAPNRAPVNSSNTAGALMSLAGRVPGLSAPIAVTNALRNTVNNASTVRNALAAEAPAGAAALTPEQANQLALLLAGGSFIAGGAAGSGTPK